MTEFCRSPGENFSFIQGRGQKRLELVMRTRTGPSRAAKCFEQPTPAIHRCESQFFAIGRCLHPSGEEVNGDEENPTANSVCDDPDRRQSGACSRDNPEG